MQSKVINAVLVVAMSVLLMSMFVGFTGCLSERKQKQKAESKVAEYSVKWPEILAAYCAAKFPVKTKTDSTRYNEGKRIIDSLAEQIRTDSLLSQDEIKGLWEEIERIRNIIPPDTGTPNCDSLSEPLYRLAAKEKKRADRLEQLNAQLVKASSNLKPVIDTVENVAKLKECEVIRDKAISNETEERTLRKTAEVKAKTRGIWMWSLIAALVAIVGYKIYSRLKPKIT